MVCVFQVVFASFQVVSSGFKWWVDSFGFGFLSLFEIVLVVSSCFWLFWFVLVCFGCDELFKLFHVVFGSFSVQSFFGLYHLLEIRVMLILV